MPLLTAAVADSAEHYEGSAYARGSDLLLYKESHWLYAADGVSMRLVLYSCPDGTPFARKLLREVPTATAPDFDFYDGRDGYREGVRTEAGQRQVFVQEGPNSPLDTRPLTDRAGGVIDAGFDLFIRSHWQQVVSGSALTVPFLLPSRFRYLDLKIANSRNPTQDDPPVRHLRMELAAWYGFALPSFELTYDPDGQRLLEFQGIGSIRSPGGKNQDVRIVYPQQKRSPVVSQDEIDRAAKMPLATHCAG